MKKIPIQPKNTNTMSREPEAKVESIHADEVKCILKNAGFDYVIGKDNPNPPKPDNLKEWVEVKIPFSGFYESVWTLQIDNILDREWDDADYERKKLATDDVWKSPAFRELRDNLTNEDLRKLLNGTHYVEFDVPVDTEGIYNAVIDRVEEAIKDALSRHFDDKEDLDITLIFKDCIHPREYNFYSDSLYVWIRKDIMDDLCDERLFEMDFYKNYAWYWSTSHDGFIPFHDYEDFFNKESSICRNTVMLALCALGLEDHDPELTEAYPEKEWRQHCNLSEVSVSNRIDIDAVDNSELYFDYSKANYYCISRMPMKSLLDSIPCDPTFHNEKPATDILLRNWEKLTDEQIAGIIHRAKIDLIWGRPKVFTRFWNMEKFRKVNIPFDGSWDSRWDQHIDDVCANFNHDKVMNVDPEFNNRLTEHISCSPQFKYWLSEAGKDDMVGLLNGSYRLNIQIPVYMKWVADSQYTVFQQYLKNNMKLDVEFLDTAVDGINDPKQKNELLGIVSSADAKKLMLLSKNTYAEKDVIPFMDWINAPETIVDTIDYEAVKFGLKVNNYLEFENINIVGVEWEK